MTFDYENFYCQQGASVRGPNANAGVRAVVEIPTTQPVSYWIGLSVIGGLWAQVGTSAGKQFYQVWRGGAKVSPNSSSNKKVGAGPHEFSIEYKNRTIWTLAIDGHPVTSYDMEGTAGSANFDALSEGCVDNQPVVLFRDFCFKVNGLWLPAQSASASHTSSVHPIGVAGHLQDATIAPVAFKLGKGIAVQPNGTQLW